MTANCPCQSCGANLEFEAGDFQLVEETIHRKIGQTIECPHCHQQTQIYINKYSPPKSSKPPIQPGNLLVTCNICGNQISRSAWFCFNCGQFHAGLFGIVWRIVCYAAFTSAVLGLIGWLIFLFIYALGRS
jgi:hypothetical protein